MVDAVDRQILKLLMQNARMSNADIARRVKLAPSAVLKRIRRLEADGVITGYEARVNSQALGLGMGCFIIVNSDERPGDVEIGERLAAMPEVQEVHFMAGNFYYLVKVRERDPQSHVDLVRRFSEAGIKGCQTILVLQTIKETSAVYLGENDHE